MILANYYLDIETTGTNEFKDKIITIQYMELERGTGKQVGNLKILKEWEKGEYQMLRQFIIDSPIANSYAFDFVSVGYNLGFENKFFLEKTGEDTKLFPITILSNPHIDLKSIAVLLNKGEFTGSGLDKLTGKPHSGSPIPDWYRDKNYDKIEEYVKKEAKEFVKFFTWLHTEIPKLRPSLAEIMKINDEET